MRTTLILASTAFLAIPALMLAPAASAENPPSVPNMSNAASTPDQAVQTTDGKFIQDLGNSAIADTGNSNVSPDERLQKYHQLLNQAFDMKNIAHFVVGRAWDRASPQQQQEYLDLFEKIVLKTYGDRLNLYNGEGFHVMSVRPESDKDSIVGSEITHPDGSAPTKIDWRVRVKDGKPEVEDVVVEGVSQSITQRDEYSSIIQQDGGKLDKLLTLMRQQAQQSQGQSQGG